MILKRAIVVCMMIFCMAFPACADVTLDELAGQVNTWLDEQRVVEAGDMLRTAYWVSSGYSLAGVASQQRDGLREANPAMTGLLGEHPSFAAGAALNLGWGVVAEKLAGKHPALSRIMWAGGTLMAVGWAIEDERRGIRSPRSTWRITVPIARF